MPAHFFPFVFAAGFIAYIIIRGVYEQRAKSSVKSIRHATPVEHVLMAMVLVGSILLPVLFLFTPWLSFADYQLPMAVMIIGTVIMIAALLLFWRSHADLGVNWSVTLELRTGHELITSGVYTKVRHPMYAAIWLFNIAQGMMIDHFGDSYRAYMQRTGRLFPRF